MATTPTRTLRPQDEISHYRIVGPLGAGGMGEVYLAQDQNLGRNVALKVLPAELVRNEERVRRFVLEARSASSLSHPNIVTIHEIGQDEVRAAGEPASDPVHFISMELVSGKTLSTLIHEDRADLRTLVGWLAQAADGLAKAHAAGIVHRDLKPGNIMVTNDGFAKVLDFGLAKLTEASEIAPDTTSDPTVGQGETGAGAVVGTAGYMSPEQVRGKSVDHRSDIFSFGCILYEAATRQRAFVADSSVETMHRVLHDSPRPIEELNAKAPAELRRLVRRCLQKNPDQRLQSMKDLALELREIEAEFDSLSASASSGSHATAAAIASRRASPLPWIAAGVLVLALGAGAWWMFGRSRPEPQPYLRMRMTSQTSSGDVVDAALSPDGRFLAHLSVREGRSSLRVRQVATGADVDIVPPSETRIANPSFSPDGNYLYYSAPRLDNPRYLALFQVPSLGGRPVALAFDVDSRVSASPDGHQITFYRHVIDTTEDRIVVFDLASRQERVLARIQPPYSIAAGPVWSPEGRQIAVGVQDARAGAATTIALFDVATGRRQDWTSLEHTFLNSAAWLPGPASFVTAGVNTRSSIFQQLMLLSKSGGRPTPVTNDFGNYFAVTAAVTEPVIAAVRTTNIGNVLVADADGGTAKRLSSATSPENSMVMVAAGDSGSVIGAMPRDGVMQICRLDAGGGSPVPITRGATHSIRPQQRAGVVVFDRIDSSGIHVWTCGADGGSPRQLVNGTGEQLATISDDGRMAVMVDVADPRTLLVVSTADGRRVREVPEAAGGGLFSPDSRNLVVLRSVRSADGLTQFRADIVPVDGGPATHSLPLPPAATSGVWAPDASALLYQDRADPAWNFYRQPIDGGPRQPWSKVTGGRLLLFAPSPDGRRQAMVVRTGDQTDLWVADAGGANPRRLAQISPETPTSLAWLRDSRRIVAGVATRAADAVLIRDFR